MNHTLTTRKLTDEEVVRIKRTTRLTADSAAWISLPVIGGFGLGLGVGAVIGGAIRQFGGRPPPHIVLYAGFVVAGIGIVPAIWLFRAFQKWHAKRQRDITTNQVQLLEVFEPRVVQQGEDNDEEPIYYLWILVRGSCFLCGANGCSIRQSILQLPSWMRQMGIGRHFRRRRLSCIVFLFLVTCFASRSKGQN